MNKHVLVGLITLLISDPLPAAEVSDQLEVFGTLELEYGREKTSGITDSGAAVSTAAFGTVIKPNDKFDITVSTLYEDGWHGVKTPLEMDEGYVTWHARPEGKLDLRTGQQYLPFGNFDSSMVSDPLTLDLGESRVNQVLTVSGINGNVHAAGYVFDGKSGKVGTNNTHGNGFGLRVGYETEHYSAGLDYLSNLTESNAFEGKRNSSHKIPTLSLHGSAQIGKVKLIGEHLTATKSFQPGDVLDEDGNSLTVAAKPSATHLETNFDLKGDRTLAISWNRTKDTEEIGLPKTFYGAAYRQPLYKDIIGAVELIQSKDYSGIKTKAFTAQLSYEF